MVVTFLGVLVTIVPMVAGGAVMVLLSGSRGVAATTTQTSLPDMPLEATAGS